MRYRERPMLLCGARFASRELASRRRAVLLFGRTEPRSGRVDCGVGPTARLTLIRARHRALRQARAITRDLAWCRDPQRIAVIHDVADRVTKRAQSERLADDEGMHRDGENERVFARLPQHLVELVD